MNKDDVINGATIAATAAAASAAEPLVHTMGVIFMGAFGGALFAVFNRAPMLRMEAVRLGIARWVFAQCLAWPMSLALSDWIVGHSWEVAKIPLMIAVAFVLACPREFAREIAPLLKLIPRAKE